MTPHPLRMYWNPPAPGYNAGMSSGHPWPDLPPEHRWTIELMEERFEKTSRSPEELSIRARELRAQAATTDLPGVRDASLALADRYEQAAMARLAST